MRSFISTNWKENCFQSMWQFIYPTVAATASFARDLDGERREPQNRTTVLNTMHCTTLPVGGRRRATTAVLSQLPFAIFLACLSDLILKRTPVCEGGAAWAPRGVRFFAPTFLQSTSLHQSASSPSGGTYARRSRLRPSPGKRMLENCGLWYVCVYVSASSSREATPHHHCIRRKDKQQKLCVRKQSIDTPTQRRDNRADAKNRPSCAPRITKQNPVRNYGKAEVEIRVLAAAILLLLLCAP